MLLLLLLLLEQPLSSSIKNLIAVDALSQRNVNIILPYSGYNGYALHLLFAMAVTGVHTGALKESEAFSCCWWKQFYSPSTISTISSRHSSSSHQHLNYNRHRVTTSSSVNHHSSPYTAFDNFGRINLSSMALYRNNPSFSMAGSDAATTRNTRTNIHTNANTRTNTRYESTFTSTRLNSKAIGVDTNVEVNTNIDSDQSHDSTHIKTHTEEHNQDAEQQEQLQSITATATATTAVPLTKKNDTTVYTFYCPAYNATLYAHGITLSQFKAWIQYKMKHATDKLELSLVEIEEMNWMQYVTSTRVDVSDSFVRDRLRKEWFERRLIVDRTEVLAVYPSDYGDGDGDNDGDGDIDGAGDDGCGSCTNIDEAAGDATSPSSSNQETTKRGGFEDLLKNYVGRLADILKDELKDGQHQHQHQYYTSTNTNTGDDGQSNVQLQQVQKFHLLEWLNDNYGNDATERLLVSNLQELPVQEQNEALLHLLHWFRDRFPYYYDQCEHCGASYREDCLARDAAAAKNDEDDKEHDYNDDGDINGDSDNNNTNDNDTNRQSTNSASNGGVGVLNDPGSHEGSFLGYCYPEMDELEGEAARTEIYHCHSCSSYTRFPRYNAVKQIVENMGRGRCGEYSILLYRILRSLGHEARWVVDWADHVWAECRIGGRWVHLDPCEAALDHPLLYEEWGKKQTYIIAFWTPLGLLGEDRIGMYNRLLAAKVSDSLPFPFVEDVTLQYTSDANATLSRRRDMKEVSIENIISRACRLVIPLINSTL